MAKNIAVRRAAKAQRRKAIVAQKRKTEIEINSTAGQVRLATATPIQHCLVSSGLFKTGIGTLVLARGATQYDVTAAVFLLDTFALGVKDVFVRALSAGEFARYVDRMSGLTPMVPVEPSHARKLLHDLTAWAHGYGFRPHPDYAKIEPLFGNIDPAACDATFVFGLDDKPMLVGDLSDSIWGSIDDDDDADMIIDGDTSDALVLEHADTAGPITDDGPPEQLIRTVRNPD